MSRPRASKGTANMPARAATSLAVPIGPQVLSLLEIGYRARRPALLEGPTGIGKSQIVQQLGKALGIDVRVLDLSLLEPPDLIGLPVIAEGRTHYASPAELPVEGRGILMLEELNRAELPVMQPALQLLSARQLHSYTLPPGWSCVAAINPEDGEYQVNRLDPALRSRFMQIEVSADRATWLEWARTHNVHPAVLRVVDAHVDAFEVTSPRSWTYASELLLALRPHERRDAHLVGLALRGFLPMAWALVLSEALDKLPPSPHFELGALLGERGPQMLSAMVAALDDDGRIDAIAMLSARLRLAFEHELAERATEQEITLVSLEALLASLPGDYRLQCLNTAVESEACETLLAGLGLSPLELVETYAASPRRVEVRGWREEMALHRVRLFAICARRWLERQTDKNVVAASAESLLALVDDAGVLADDLSRALRARGVDVEREG